jgi:hypothetical protein
LSSLGASELPKVMLAAAGLGLVSVLGVSQSMARLGPGRLIPLIVAASAALHALEWALLGRFPTQMAVLLYLHASVAGGIAISGLWSIVSERFDPHTARQISGRLAAGSASGGLLGGIAATGVSATQGIRPMLLGLAISASAAALVLRALAGNSPAARPAPLEATDVRSVTSSRYLGAMAALVALIGLANVIVDYSLKVSVATHLRTGTDLLAFFAVFYTVTSIASVLLQLSVAPWVLNQTSLGTGLAALPGAIVALGVLAVVAPTRWVFIALRGVAATLETSLFRSAYEPLYAPLPAQQKRSAKTIIDVACNRLGEGLGSGVVLALGSTVPLWAGSGSLVLAVAAATVCIWLSFRLEHGYVEELAASLRTGKIKLEATHIGDATTRFAISQTQLEFDRNALLRQIAELRGRTPKADPPRPGSGAEPSAPGPSNSSGAALVSDPDGFDQVRAFLSGDAGRIRTALSTGPLALPLVSLVIPLLERDDLTDVVLRALREVSPKVVGQLVDVLLDQERPLRLRQRIPRVLRACPHPRAVRGMTEALSDPEFAIRYRCGLALFDLTANAPRLRPPRQLVLAAAKREMDLLRSSQSSSGRTSDAEDEFLGTGARASGALADRALHHVFTLLGLTLDREALDLALRALSGADEKLRGTALEYLEHVVPEPVRGEIWSYLREGYSPGPGSRRSPTEIVAELKRSFG